MKKTMITLTVAGSLALAGCAGMDQTQKGAALGAGLGALAGAAIGGDSKGALIGAGVGAAGGYIWSKQMEQKKAAMERAVVGTGVAVTQTADNQLKLNVPSDVSFDTGRADIKPNLRPILDQFANGLAGQASTEVRIIGHTDNTGTDALNDRLSVERAESTKQYLVARGVDPRRIVIAGRGEKDPVADNSTDSGRARNRRVEIYLGERSNVAAR